MDIYDDQKLKEMLADKKLRRKGFEQVVRQSSETLYWQVRRIVLDHEDANDVLQNALLKAWAALDSFHGESKVLTWMSRIAINEALDFMRRQKNRIMVSADEVLGVAQQLMADDYFDGDATEAQLQEAIERLPEVQRTVFRLRYYDEMKYSEMSRILGTSEGGLKASYHIAVKKISEFFHNRD